MTPWEANGSHLSYSVLDFKISKKTSENNVIWSKSYQNQFKILKCFKMEALL